MSAPRELVKLDLNVTNRCNYRCRHCCFASGERTTRELGFLEIKKILEEFVRIGGRRIDITGGEPLVRQDLSEMVAKLAKELKIKTELVTNGSLLTEEMLGYYKEIGLDGTAISLDGSEAEVYNHIRCRDETTFKKVIQAIQRSVEWGFYTKVNTVVFASNLHDLEKISKYVIDLGVQEHGYYYFSPIGRGERSSSEVADPILWLQIIRTKLWALKDQIKFSLETPLLEAELAQNLNIACFMEDPWHLQILPDGNVYPCAIMAAYGRPLANLRRVNLSQIWKAPSLWDQSYYHNNILPLFEKYAGCVYYPSFSSQIQSGQYRFVCLCKKFKIEELQR